MENIDLKDIIPKKSEFSVETSEGVGLDFALRPFTLRDQSWVNDNWDKEEVSKVFTDMRYDEIAKIAYHQLDVESKKRVCEIIVMDYDEEKQEEVKLDLKGWEKLQCCILGEQAKIDMLKALLKSWGASMPLMSSMSQDEEKKKT